MAKGLLVTSGVAVAIAVVALVILMIVMMSGMAGGMMGGTMGGMMGGNSRGSGSSTPVAPVDGALTVRGFEWGFEPQVISLTRGERVEITFQNDGRTLHNFKIRELAADDIVSHSSGPLSGDENQLYVGADAGLVGTLSFVPQTSGSFTFYCTIRGHEGLGMQGTLTVD